MPARPPRDDESEIDNVVRVDFARPTAGMPNLQKLQMFTDSLARGVTMIVLDARREGVVVPIDFAGELDLRLNFSHRYGLKDFTYDEKGIEATLSFPQGFYFCCIPWSSVFAVQSLSIKSGAVWPEDVPPELQVQVADGKEKSDITAAGRKKSPRAQDSLRSKKSTFLRLVTEEQGDL